MNWFRRYRRRREFVRVYDRVILYLDRQKVGRIDPRLTVPSKLRKGEVVVTPADIAAFAKLDALISGEATDRVSFAELQESLNIVMTTAVKHVPAARRADFLAECKKLLGGIGDET